MIDELTERVRHCDGPAVALWACSGLLLTLGTYTKTHEATEWGLYVSAAAAARTVHASTGRSTTRIVSHLNRLVTEGDRTARRTDVMARPSPLRRAQPPGADDAGVLPS